MRGTRQSFSTAFFTFLRVLSFLSISYTFIFTVFSLDIMAKSNQKLPTVIEMYKLGHGTRAISHALQMSQRTVQEGIKRSRSLETYLTVVESSHRMGKVLWYSSMLEAHPVVTKRVPVASLRHKQSSRAPKLTGSLGPSQSKEKPVHSKRLKLLIFVIFWYKHRN